MSVFEQKGVSSQISSECGDIEYDLTDSKTNNNKLYTSIQNECKDDDGMDDSKDEDKTDINDDDDDLEFFTKNFKCKCGESNLKEHQLLCCKNKKCEGNIYCKTCVKFYHEFFSQYQHELNENELISVNKLFNNPEHDKAKLKYGKMELFKLYGQTLYNTIIPYVETGTIVTYTGAIGTALVVETSATLSASAYAGAHFAKHIVGVGLGVAAGAFAIELMVNGRLWLKDEISGKELLKRTGKSFIRNGTLCAGLFGVKYCAIGGAQFGATVFAAAGPVTTAVAAAVGTFFGVLLSVGAAWYIAKKLNKKIDDNYVFDDELKRKQALTEALVYFHFSQDAVDDPKKFNAKILHKKYKIFAFDCHPDRPNGDAEAFIKLNTFYGILLALCEDVPQNRKKTILKNIPKSLEFAAK